MSSVSGQVINEVTVVDRCTKAAFVVVIGKSEFLLSLKIDKDPKS